MKKIALSIFCFGMLATSFTSCNDAKNDVIENRVYLQEAVATPLSDVVMGDPGQVTSAPVTVRLAKALPTDVVVNLDLDQPTLDAYNKRNSTVYEMVPTEYIDFPSQVVLKAGETSYTVPVQVTSFKGEAGVDYALALAIKSTQGLDASTGSSAFIYALSAPLKQAAPSFRSRNACRLQPATVDWGLSLPNYTVEFWVRVCGLNNYTGEVSTTGGYSVNNQAIFANGDSPELYVRFGDLIYSSGGSYKNNFLQIKTFGGQFDTGDPTKGNGLVSGQWYHIAWTYDAATGTSTLYKNGSQVSQLTTGVGREMIINHINMFDSGSGYFRDNVEMAQLRMWNVTRTPTQIAKFMRKEVRYTDPNLIFYLPMNEGEGAEKLADVTGNGHDMLIGKGAERYNEDGSLKSNNGGTTTAFAWNEYDFSSL